MRLVAIGLLLILTGCADTPLNGRIVVHLTNAGIVVQCEPLHPTGDRNSPDERK